MSTHSLTELAVLHDHLKRAQEVGRIGLWEWRFADNSLIWNEEVYRLFDKDPRTFIPTYESWQATIHPEDREQVERQVQSAIKNGGDYDIAFRTLLHDGSTRWIATRGGVEFDADGRPARMIGLTFDITERKGAEAALEEKERELRLITDALPAMIAYIDRELRYQFNNRFYETEFGLTPEQLKGMQVAETLGPQFETVRPYMERALAGHDVSYNVTLVHPRTGQPWHCQCKYIPDRIGNEVRGFFVLVNDVTILRTSEEALRRSEKLAATGRLAATIAHEINNPLEAITNLVFLSESDPDATDTIRHYLQMAEQELRRVHHIVNQTLVFYRDRTAPAVLDISEKISNLLALYGRKIQSKEVKIAVDVEGEAKVIGMPGELRQCLANILSNAIDAVAIGGKITIRVRQQRSVLGNGPGLRISVADDGCGIPYQDRARIFEPFFTTKNDVGTGLGLWVAHGIVEKHGGAMRVRTSVSPSRHGTVFTIVLPRDTVGAGHRAQTSVAA